MVSGVRTFFRMAFITANTSRPALNHSVVIWERLAEICGQYLGKGPVSVCGSD